MTGAHPVEERELEEMSLIAGGGGAPGPLTPRASWWIGLSGWTELTAGT